MVPLRAGQDRDVRPVGIEVAGVLVGLDDERRTRPDPGGRRRAAGQRPRQQRPDEGRRVGAGRDEGVDQPAGGRALAVRPGHAHERPPDGGVGDDLLPGLDRHAGRPRRQELGVVGVDRGQRLGHGQPVGAPAAGHVLGGMLGRDLDAERLEGRRVRRRPARVAAAHQRPGSGRQQGRGARPGTGGPDDVDPLELADRAGLAGRRQPGTDAVRGGRHPRSVAAPDDASAASIRSSRRSSAASALRRLLSLRSPLQTCRRTATPTSSATAT